MIDLEYVIIIAILLIIALAVVKANREDIKFEINKLVEYLGGKDNIISSEYSFHDLK